MNKLVVLFAGLFLSAAASKAQRVTGIVKDQQGKGIEKSTVSLLNAKDSSIIKLAASAADGRFVISTTKYGSMLISVSHVGYKTSFTQTFEVSGTGDVNLGEINIAKADGDLKGVTVTSKKPMVEVRADKTILNVEGTINATGNDALELLRRSPSVMVDKDENISLAGKNGVQIYVDGKPTPLSGTDLSNYLKSMQSSQIEAIEIITNPSAKYEAAGNAGIINIKLKKNKAFGTNGSVNAGYVQGFYPKFNGGLNLNYRNKKINLFGSYNYNNGKYRNEMNGIREQFDTSFVQNNTIVFRNNTHGFKGGADYFIDNKNTVGVVVNGNLASNDLNTDGPMYFTYKPTGTTNRVLKATNHNDMQRNNMNTNLNYRYAVTGGSELNIDADYGFFRIKSDQYQPNYYYLGDGTTETSRVIYKMTAPTDINLYSLKADYEKNYKGGRLGFGGKVGFVNTDNDFKRYDVFTTGNVLDTLKSNRFDYKENINALYVNYNKQLKNGIMFQAGLRAENTHSKGNSTGFQEKNGSLIPYDSTFTRSYTDVFPSAAVTFNKNPMKMWTLSYSRRIDRPAYQDLNPFEFKLNEYTFMKGNTMLKPQYTNSIDITHIYKYKLTTKLTFSHVKDIFAQLPDTTDKTKAFSTKKNLASQNVVALNISYPFQYKWYGFFVNVNSNYSRYKADFGGGDRVINQDAFSYIIYLQNTFNLGKGWTGELTGLYVSPMLWQGLFKSVPMGFVDAGLQKTIFKGKGNMKFAISDIFRTMQWGGDGSFAGAYNEGHGHGEMQQFKFNISYRFGNSQVKAARQRKSAIDDEKKRAEGGGNQQGGIGQQ